MTALDDDCPVCGGTGWDLRTDTLRDCSACDGFGTVPTPVDEGSYWTDSDGLNRKGGQPT